MAKCDKLIEQARASKTNIRFEDLVKLMKCYGFVFRKPKGGSHRNAISPLDGQVQSVQPKNGKAKPYQVRQVLAIIDELEERAMQEGDQ